MNTQHRARPLIGPFIALVLVAGLTACGPQSTSTTGGASGVTGSKPAAASSVTIPRGTEVHVTLATAVGSGTSVVGDPLTATTLTPIVIGDHVAIPTNSTVSGRVTHVDTGKKGLDISEKGGSVVLSFTSLKTPGGATTPISASIVSIAPSKGKTGGIIGGSAAGGALLAKILGGDSKDVAAGAVVGGGIGTAIAAGTKGKALEISAGTELTMILDQSVSVASNR